MLDFLAQVFDTSGFPPRWNCGSWSDAQGWLHILSDLAIWSAYFAIPCILVYFVLRRRDVPFRAIFLLFGGFIVACGTTHLMEAIIFWHPLYRLAGVIKLFTAIISWGTVVALVPIIPKALAMRSPEELERVIKERTAELTQANETLRAEVRERQRAEEEITRLNRELQSRADELQTILNIVPIGVAIAHDPQCNRITHNPYMSELLNVPAWSNASLTAPQDERPTNFTNYRDGQEVPTSELPMQVACTGVEVRDVELDLVCLGRETRKMLYHARPLLDEQGQARGGVGVCLDITDRLRAEEALKEADRRKDEFLAMLAHELRGPLAPLVNLREIMERADGNKDMLQQARTTMERQLGQLVRLVDDLIDVSRLSRNMIELRKERMELASVIHQAVETCHPLAKVANHQLNVMLPPEPIYLDADPVRLAQVFGNILNNACKYTDPGGRIWLTAERQGSDVIVRVKDMGIGIPPDKLGRIFEMFMQVDRTLERSQSGLGIGLTLVKRLVEMHDGTVEAFSEGPGQGSEFVVRLPVLIEISKAKKSEPTSELTMVSDRRILIVDDNTGTATSLAMLLNTNGNETHTANDGLEAMEAAERLRPDVILLDIGLPKLNGYDCCRRIREQPWGKKMVIVALTGWGQDDDQHKSKDAGLDGILVKPVGFAAIMKLLTEMLSPV